MPQTQTTARVEEEEGEPLNINPRLLAFRPRQVSLLINSTKMPSAAVKTPSVPKPNQKTLLLHSIALYLQRSGYSKTVKKLRSESDVQQSICPCSDQGSKKPETITSQEKAVSAEVEKSAENGAEIKGGESGASFQFVATAEVENKKKSKKKKSKKLDVDNVESVSEDKKEVVSNMDLDNAIAEKKLKKQKKNSKKLSSTNAEEDALKVSETTVDTENQDKESKKRKRPSSQDISTPPADDEKPTEKSKRQKTEAADTQTQESNGQAIEDGALASENLEKKEQKAKKSSKKQQNGPSEPTTAQRFQRVKADEVVFSDERLKDNSYWAKDGAEIGYGAKAQEVLGQVKGKGFRHEKTKKKRGSYRGGQIDQNTHSVKFNYSDEE
ncbi:Nucleolar and coiled-body phosphoprotein 1 [Linum grandiflorum]